MARPLRIEYPGAVYHITSRGNRRAPIFINDDDMKMFFAILEQTAHRFNTTCHAYCLMNNHYHLILETPEGNLSRAMRHLNGVFTQSFNHKHRKVGHLLQGRYKAILVERGEYFLQACRYIVLNPVRAKICAMPDDWLWSSYLATAGRADRLPFLHTGCILEQFDKDAEVAMKKYSTFVMDGIGIELWNNLISGIALGTAEFAARHIFRTANCCDMTEIPKIQRYATRPCLNALMNVPGDIWGNALIAVDRFGYTQKDLSDYLGVHYTTVSRHLRPAQLKRR